MRPLRGRLLVMLGALSLLVLVAGCRGNGADDANAKQAQSASTTIVPPAGDRAAGDVADRSEPQMITTLDQLQAMNADLDGHYALRNDIDASATEGWNDGAGFEPIGTKEARFNGIFDGRGHVITGLFIDRGKTDYVGLFGYTGAQSEISSVGITDATVVGLSAVGALVGRTEGLVTDSYSESQVKGMLQVGGLAGYNYGRKPAVGAITDSHFVGEVIGENNVGGLVGLTVGGSIANSFSSGAVSGNREVGGLVGYHNGTTTTASYSTVEVVGTHFNIGGLVGVSEGHIESSYSIGDVTGSVRVGGLVGRNRSSIEASYSVGAVVGDEDVGGLVGEQHEDGEEPLRSYWDADEAELVGAGDDLGEAKTTAEMMQGRTFADWDFSETWAIVERGGYPDLIDNPRSR